MHIGRLATLAIVAGFLGGCAVGISDLNARPTKHYQETVTFKGRVSRMQDLPGEVLLEIADSQEHRILVRAAAPLDDVHADDWVKVSGVLVPEARVGGKIVYDVVQAESVTPTGAPWLRNLF